MPRRRAWVRYIENKYGVTLQCRECAVDLENLVATQTEIERIKYQLVQFEAFRQGEPILVYKGRYGGYFIVDGHTRARVHWDLGDRTIPATLCTSGDVEVAAEMNRIALEVGDGREKHVWEIPITDRVGEGTPAWEIRKSELLHEWAQELDALLNDPLDDEG